MRKTCPWWLRKFFQSERYLDAVIHKEEALAEETRAEARHLDAVTEKTRAETEQLRTETFLRVLKETQGIVKRGR